MPYVIYINKTIICRAFIFREVYITKAHQRYKYEGLATYWGRVVSYNDATTTWSLIILEWETGNLVPELQVQTRIVQGMTVPVL